MQVQNNWIFGILYTFIIYVKGFTNIEKNEGISIGIISDDNMEPLQKTFNYAITVANTDLGIPLIGNNEQIKFGDSIEGHAKLCKFMQTGIGAIFGPSSRQTSAHLLTVCDAKDVPYIYPHMSENVEGFNLYPNPIDLARILHDIINLFEWTHFTFLYESSEYLSILNGLMSFYNSDGPVINVLRYDLKLSGNFKAVLRRVRKSEDGHIVVVGSTPSVAELLKQINMQEKTITGPIYFDGNIRKGYILDIVELQTSGLVKIGTWDERNNLTIQRPPQLELWSEVDANSLVNKTFRVLISVPNKPYASLVESHKKLVGNNQYEGYSIDLIKELAAKLGFNYTFIDGGSDYGSFNKTTNKTTGMMKEINEGRADLAITDLTITSEREEIIDFSIPFMNLGIAILYTQPQKSPANNFSFMDPFSRQVWIYLGLVYIGVSFCFFILGRLSPTEWDNPYPCIEEPEELENQFTLNNSFWFTTGAFLQQGSEIAPKSLSTRTLASIWWFFTLIILSSYTANLAAFLTIEKPVGLINNVNELASDTRVKYGAKKTGSTRSFFSTSEHETYKKMNDFMVKNPDLLFETNLEGVNRVKSDNYYAFLMESTSIEYHIVRECNLKKVGEPLDEKGYGIAMVKNWPYRDKFNNALLELQEQGVLARLKNKWWNEVGAGVCKKKTDSSEVNPLDLKSLGGVYLVLGVGSGISLIYSLIMWCIYVARKSNYYEVPFRDAFLEELRIAIDLANNERILKSAQSVYSRSRNSLVSIDSIDTDSEIENSSKTDGESEKTI
ncbi:glutamate receptor ionotropic, kainate 2 isoform X5 [Bactrocera neohumeralis]|uniref:glutamate receptor ionotropic, kainate 2 isoform X4 n=1 Tax=Bactrocera tryoni TaxID=59916 RepID=UPI001A96C6D2|nr:glutamate receptor ionotropic, kainate 2 isoform X4 [Bactrocera tryoni]XP_050319825.1 glutamate receptor ionotropic, kainate 2 isoform X5 [Bactrocera neohumeralis]